MKNLNSGGVKSGKFRGELRMSNDSIVIKLSLIEYQFLIQALEYPQDFKLREVKQMVLDKTKIIKRKPTVVQL